MFMWHVTLMFMRHVTLMFMWHVTLMFMWHVTRLVTAHVRVRSAACDAHCPPKYDVRFAATAGDGHKRSAREVWKKVVGGRCARARALGLPAAPCKHGLPHSRSRARICDTHRRL
eukprot:7014756-Prymnesium_polylepis.1